jgi:TolB-like protein/cytochrome c-type biogenesis protein CcmH/NrfG
MNFFSELKRRNVYKVAVAYAVVGWLVIQVSSTVLPTFHAPEWVVQSLVVLVAIGFPIALVIAWAFELTPEGLKRTENADSSTVRPRRKHAWIYVVVIGAAFSIGLFFIGRYTASNSAAPRQDVSAARAEVPTTSSIPQKSIAVLPFENLSDDKGAAYFADGIEDEILTKLASIADLKVISRTSTAKYKSKPEDLRTVSQQLGVATVLEGSVQKAADKVRVNVQLIDARADSHLWAKSYDRDIQDIFAVESEVAQEIADALKAKLSPAEANKVASAPTKDTQAYDLFLKGEYEQRAAISNFRPESFDQAARWYEEAIARDPNFALAIAELAICRLRQHWLTDPLSESELAQAGQRAKQAVTLAPDLAEAHVAMGLFHYYGFRKYEAALTELQRATELQPNNSRALQFIAAVHRRQDRWKSALDELKKALEEDPRDANVASTIAETHLLLRDWKDAEMMARHALTIDPHETVGMHVLLLSSLNLTGNTEEPLRLLASFSPNDVQLPNTGTYDMVIGSLAEMFVLGRDFKSALKVWEGSSALVVSEGQRLAAKAVIHVFAGDASSAETEAENARKLLEARVRDFPQDIRSLRALGWVYLALNRKADAINIARQTLDLLPPERDAFLGTDNLTSLAEMQAQTDAARDAVQNLRKLLSMAAGDTVSIARLKIDPVWDPIRNDPGFQQLLTMKEQVGP